MVPEEAFGLIAAKLKAARGRGIKPSIRASGREWVCAIEEQQKRFIIIAKETELMLVDMESKTGEPTIERVHIPDYDQQNVIEKVREAVAEAYGALPPE